MIPADGQTSVEIRLEPQKVEINPVFNPIIKSKLLYGLKHIETIQLKGFTEQALNPFVVFLISYILLLTRTSMTKCNRNMWLHQLYL